MRTSLKVAIGSVVVVLAMVAFALAALGNNEPAARGSDGEDGSQAGGGMAMCVEEAPDCDDMVVVPGEEPVSDGDEPVSHDADGDPGVEPGDPQVVVPDPDAVDLRARPFDSATAASDGRSVTIDFVSGIEPCYVLGRVDVDEGPNAVTITLFEGHLETGGDVACIDIGVFKRTVVTLDEPLGDREIVDGAA